MSLNNLSNGKDNLKSLVDKLTNDCYNHIKKLLEENYVYNISDIKNIQEDAIIQLLFEFKGKDVNIKPYRKSQVPMMSTYIQLKNKSGKNINNINIYSKVEINNF